MSVRQEAQADLSIEARNRKWLTDLAQLTLGVEALFTEHSKLFKPPTPSECHSFASALMALASEAS